MTDFYHTLEYKKSFVRSPRIVTSEHLVVQKESIHRMRLRGRGIVRLIKEVVFEPDLDNIYEIKQGNEVLLVMHPITEERIKAGMADFFEKQLDNLTLAGIMP